jgi:peroxiredoxin
VAFLVLVLATAAGRSASGADGAPVPPAPGAVVPTFKLVDIHRRPRSLDRFKDKKAFVIVFLGVECPLANLYAPSLSSLHKEYAPKGVQLLGINSNVQDAFVRVSAHAQERELPFPVLKDFDHKVADAFGAKRTPEVFLLDASRTIRYHGRIDDQYGIGYQRDEPARRDLREAIEELLAQKTVTVPQAEAPGCLISRARKPRVEGKVTYAQHAALVFQRRCQECHRPGEIGPFSLLTYDDARSWADTIHEVILEERMPPWHADPRYGRFSNDRRLSREEADTLLEWVDQGCLKGADTDLPPAVKFTPGWKLGEPEAVFRMEEEFQVPATGVLPYYQFSVDPGFKEEAWVQAAECRPGNRAVVHHVIVYILAPGKALYDIDGTAATLAGWAPGDMPTVFAPGTAKRVPARSKLIFEVHYTPNGTAQRDRSSVGLWFAKQPPEDAAETNILANLLLRIPPGAPDHRSEVTFTFRDDALILSFMPHMHLRGTSGKYVATYPDGRSETLLSIPDYDFGWQSVYRFAEPLRVPKGTRLVWSGRWDNSADNPRNPDPTKEVGWGLQTWDEMHNGWMELVRNPGR